MSEENMRDTVGTPAPQEPAPAPQEPAPVPQEPAPAPQYTPPQQPEYRPPQGGYATSYGYPPYQQPPQPPKNRGGGVIVAMLCILCVIGIAGMGIALAWSMGNISADSTSSSADPSNPLSNGQTQPTVNSNAPQIEIGTTIESTNWAKEAIQKVLPSTVVLSAYSGNSLAGAATGIIYSKDGYIITNAHCVYDSDTGRVYDYIDVELYDGTLYENAKICGYDTSTDLAVIKVEATDLTPASFGSADALELGDYVVAVGNAAGLAWSASMGIISGLDRDVYEDTGYAIPCLQVDAAINPGNSGGPLVNAAGQVVGINSLKIVVEGYENLAFSIPINAESKAIIDALAYQGKVTGRVSLGIRGQTVTTLHYEGFYVGSISAVSPLKGKVSVGDIIQYVDGVRVTSYAELRTELAKHKVGDEVTLKLLHIERRTGKETQYEVKVKLIDASDVQ